MPTIVFTVTNDLQYDQRMNRIAGSLAEAGNLVLLVGRKLPDSTLLKKESYRQKRIRCLFNKGVFFYLEYNLRLFCFLLFTQADIFCAIDLDTILPVYFVSVLKRKQRVYDAHELFTEQNEIITRPFIHTIWLAVEKFAVPRFPNGYTVNDFIAAEFTKRYGVSYAVIRNLPILYPLPNGLPEKKDKWIIYQGAVNKGRCFETLIPAMKDVNARLIICGKGNFFNQTQRLIWEHQLESRIELRGLVSPDELKQLTPTAYIGITLFEATGLNQYHSLANRFFDYMMAGIPQVCVNYPEYAAINQKYQIASLLNNTEPAAIAAALNNLLVDDVLYKELTANCLSAREILNWEEEKKALLNFYTHL